MTSDISIQRYPSTSDGSLQGWNAADEHVIKHIQENDLKISFPLIFNDRFGYLYCHLNEWEPQMIRSFRSQEKAIQQNAIVNQISSPSFIDPLPDHGKQSDLGIIKIPKSMDLFRLYLHHAHQKVTKQGQVICAFMTKYFSPKMLEIAALYFEEVEQSRAFKKSRLLLLRKKKVVEDLPIIESFDWMDSTFYQYLGVFSSGHIDYATQFFLENLVLSPNDTHILDLASGNGVIAHFAKSKLPNSSVHLVDDSWLAIASSKLNLTSENCHFHYNNGLDDLESESLDLVLSNPPFHFDFEPNTEITFHLFEQVSQKLKPGGHFKIVANRHLPYKPQLLKFFSEVSIFKQNEQFIIYNCKK